jgi:hypothetical protein
MLKYAASILASLLISSFAFANDADEFPEDGPSREMTAYIQGQSEFPPNIDYIISNLGKRDSFKVGVPLGNISLKEDPILNNYKIISKKEIGNNVIVEIDTTSRKSNFTQPTIQNQNYTISNKNYSLNYSYGYGYVVAANIAILSDSHETDDEYYKYTSEKISKLLMNKGFIEKKKFFDFSKYKVFEKDDIVILISDNSSMKRTNYSVLVSITNRKVVKEATESLEHNSKMYDNQKEKDIDRIFK